MEKINYVSILSRKIKIDNFPILYNILNIDPKHLIKTKIFKSHTYSDFFEPKYKRQYGEIIEYFIKIQLDFFIQNKDNILLKKLCEKTYKKIFSIILFNFS